MHFATYVHKLWKAQSNCVNINLILWELDLNKGNSRSIA